MWHPFSVCVKETCYRVQLSDFDKTMEDMFPWMIRSLSLNETKKEENT